jgi:hypothetical protein
VRAYSAVFWKNVHKIEGYERYVAAIEKGEKRRERESQMEQILAKKVAQYKQPWSELQIKYGASKSKIYLEDEDQFLVCMTHELGYGEWDALKDEVRRAWQFRFDWFIKSRSAAELGRRVDVLIRIIEKEGRKPKSTAVAVTTTESTKPKPRTTANSSSVVATALPPRKRAKKAAAANSSVASTNDNNDNTNNDDDDDDDDDENDDDDNNDDDNNDNAADVDADLARLDEEEMQAEMQAAEDAELHAVQQQQAENDGEFESAQASEASTTTKKRKPGTSAPRKKRGESNGSSD